MFLRSLFKFQIGNVVKRDPHGRGFATALRLMGVGVVEAAPAVGFVDLVHRMLQLHAAGVVVFCKK